MKHVHTGFRSVLALVLLGTVAGICFSLGNWQLGRAAERDALHNAIELGRAQAPLSLSAASRPADFMPWRPALARGHWAAERTVLLENRNLDGRPGYWVATPLLLESIGQASQDPAHPRVAVLVLRGWLPRDMQAQGVPPKVPAEPGLVEVSGELHTHVPRIFELWSWAGGKSSQLPDALPHGAPGADRDLPVVQNLTLQDFAAASGLTLLPTVLAQTQDTLFEGHTSPQPQRGGGVGGGGDVTDANAYKPFTLRRDWPGPSLDSDQNRGYALQWFSFSAIAAIAALFILRGMFRGGMRKGRHKDAS